jgi:hypothetical protein
LALLLLLTLPGCFDSPPQIVNVDPDRGSIGVPANAPITVVFDRPVVHSSVASRFSVTPALQCDLHQAFGQPNDAACYVAWLNNQSGFTFYHPAALFDANTKYVFHLDSGVRSVSGVANSLNHDWDITSALAPAVAGVTPANGSTGVPIDLPLVVSFSRDMSRTQTEAAITLSPSVPGTRVLGSSTDLGRYLVVPGHLLRPNSQYTLTIGGSAKGTDGQRLAAGEEVHFGTGELSGNEHAAVVTAASGQGGSAVDMASLRPQTKGDPAVVQQILTAPTCAAGGPGCGAAPAGSAVVEYDAATLSPAGAFLATVEADLTSATPAKHVAIYNVVDQKLLKIIPGASNPVWNSQESLAFSTPNGVGIFHPATGQLQTLELPGSGGPDWSLNQELLVSVPPDQSDHTAAAGQPLYLVNLDAGAVDPVPKTEGATGFISDGGRNVVFNRTASKGLYRVDLGTGDQLQTLTTSSATAVGFASGNGVIAVAGSHLVLIRLSDGSTQTISGGPPTSDFARVQVLARGKQLGWVAKHGGAEQVDVSNVDGSGVTTITDFPAGTNILGLSFGTA